ncbi:hypothetical protein D3C81_1960650 [compost metagenome]
MVYQCVEGFFALRRNGVLALQTEAKREVHELQYVLVTFGFLHEARQYGEDFLSTPGFVVEDAEQGFLAPATGFTPRPVHDSFIDEKAKTV